jgi:hypothetical protein
MLRGSSDLLNNIADVGIFPTSNARNYIFAITTDKTLYLWGCGEYLPVKIATDIVNIVYDMALSSEGLRFTFNSEEKKLKRTYEEINTSIYCVCATDMDLLWIDSDNVLCTFAYDENHNKIIKPIAENAIKLREYTPRLYSLNGGYCIYYIKTDNTL